jgi:hypothetical protein
MMRTSYTDRVCHRNRYGSLAKAEAAQEVLEDRRGPCRVTWCPECSEDRSYWHVIPE